MVDTVSVTDSRQEAAVIARDAGLPAMDAEREALTAQLEAAKATFERRQSSHEKWASARLDEERRLRRSTEAQDEPVQAKARGEHRDL